MRSISLHLILRSLLKRKSFSVIHIIGLTLGLTCCLLVYLFISYELSFDQYHSKADRIYRFTNTYTNQNGVKHSIGTPHPMAVALRNDIPDFEKVARVHFFNDGVIEIQDQNQLQIEDILFADPEIFEIFDFEVLKGETKKAFAQPNQVIITASLAQKLFQDENPIGQSIRLENTIEGEIAGVIADPPNNTHMRVSLFFSLESLNRELVGGLNFDSWGTTIGNVTYALLPEYTRPESYEEPLSAFVKKYMTDESGNSTNQLNLQPLSDIHFNTLYANSLSIVPPIAPFYLWLFGLIGLLIVAVACFNFINLSTAQAVQRGKEVGVRKVLGAEKWQLVSRFMGEALILSLLSGALAFTISYMTLPWVNRLLDKSIPGEQLTTLKTLVFLFFAVVIVSLISGIYPAYGLARFQPVKIMGSRNTAGNNQSLVLRRILVVSQFVITVILIIATLTISQQVKYMKNKDLGFDQSEVIVVGMPERGYFDQLRTQWLQNAGIADVSFCIGAPTSESNISTSFNPKGEDANQLQYENALKAVDYHYLNTFGLEMVAGRWFTEQENQRATFSLPEEEQSFKFVVNEKLTALLGYEEPSDIIGKQLQVSVNNVEAEVIGVVKDFNLESLENEVEPTILMNLPFLYFQAGLKLKTTDIESAIAHIEAVWSEKFPDHLFEYNFLDERIEQLYESETRLFYLFQILAGIAILISCLGLLGLISFITEQRTKEIGIRKVLGASVMNIIGLLSKDFLRLVLIALLIAGPVSYFVMNRWLQNFAYRIDLTIGFFLLTGVIAIAITLLTISIQSVKAALTNPVSALRDE